METSSTRREPNEAGAPRRVLLLGARGSGRAGIAGALRDDGVRASAARWLVDGPLDDADRAYLDAASLALRVRELREIAVPRAADAVTLPLIRRGDPDADPICLTIPAPATGAVADVSLAGVAGIIIAIDARPAPRQRPRRDSAASSAAAGPVESNADSAALVDDLFLRAGGTGELPRVPLVVLLLTKIDRLGADEMRLARVAPERWITAAIGEERIRRLDAATHLRCAAVSAAGTVRNAIRPMGVTELFDLFGDTWRRREREAAAATAQRRRAVRAGRARRIAPRVAAGILLTAGAALGITRLLRAELARRRTWTVADGGTAPAVVAPRRGAMKIAARRGAPATNAGTPTAASTAAAMRDALASLAAGRFVDAVDRLDDAHVPPRDPARDAADSLVASAAIGSVELAAAAHDGAALNRIAAVLTSAIDRSAPGTPRVATLSLARAGACVAASLGCADAQVREDLAWAVLLGAPAEQDAARRLRTTRADDSSRAP